MNAKNAIEEKLVLEKAADGAAVAGHVTLGADFPGFQGHFPGNPMLPGVCHILVAEVFAARATSLRLELAELHKTKFFVPVKPDTPLTVSGRFERTEDRLAAEITLMSGETRVSVVKCRFRVME
mgnify:CR=1 FL=1